MSDYREEERPVGAGHEHTENRDDTREQQDGEAEGASARRGQGRNEAETTGEVAESEILRGELMRVQEELREEKARSEELKDRFMRARADLENYRKRAAGDAERARDAGLDSAVLPLLSVFDDLRRALEAADTSDPASIVPGVQSVLATLERNLEALGIRSIGSVGEAFDPDLHEALTSVPAEESGKSDTIAEVFQPGFQKGDRLIRPARVVVYQD